MEGSLAMARRNGTWRVSIRAVLLVLALVMAATLPAATLAQGGKTKIVWSTWGNPDELTRFDEFNKDFMARHPDIEVVLQPVPSYSDYHSKLLAQLISGTAPDLFYVGDDNIGKFVDSNVLQPLDKLMASDGSKITPADFFDGLFGAARKDGATYGIPVDDNPDVFWYDKQALAAAGITEDPAELAAKGEWTTAKFLEMVDKLKAAKLVGAMFWNYWATHWSWVSANGGTVFDDQGKFVLPNDPTSIAALKTLGERFQDGSFVVADTMPEGAGPDTTFLTHGAGFFSQGRYTIGTVKSGGEQDSYDIVRWPTVDGKPRPTGVAAAYMGINKASPNIDAAWQFYQDFLSADGQRFRLSKGGNAVPSIKGADDVVLEGYPAHAQTFLDVRDTGFVDFAAEARVPGLSSDISTAMQQLYEGKATIDATVTKMTDLVNAAH
jgi:multiple sugar transport system substrate-binding protein